MSSTNVDPSVAEILAAVAKLSDQVLVLEHGMQQVLVLIEQILADVKKP